MTLSLGHRIVLLFLIVSSMFFMALNPLKQSQYVEQSDEGYYYSYARLVQEKGLGAFGHLLGWYDSNVEAQQHPLPIRAGYILLTAKLFDVFGASYSILGACSIISFLLFLTVCFYYIRKFYDLDKALLVTVLLSSSPLILGLSRRALIDAPINFLWGSLIFLFLDLLLRPNHYKYTLFVGVLFFSITVKEVSLILIPFFLMFSLWAKTKQSIINYSFILGLLIWPLFLAVGFYIWVLGGFENFVLAMVNLIKTHLSSQYVNDYAYEYSSGPWFRYILDFLLLNPLVTLLSVGFLGVIFVKREELDFKTKYLLAYFIFVYGFLSLLPHSKVVRFVINLEMIMAIFAVGMLSAIFKKADSKEFQRRLVFAVVIIYFMNWKTFLNIFFVHGLLDPISYNLLVLQNFLPSM